jgi:hypothetical protein
VRFGAPCETYLLVAPPHHTWNDPVSGCYSSEAHHWGGCNNTTSSCLIFAAAKLSVKQLGAPIASRVRMRTLHRSIYVYSSKALSHSTPQEIGRPYVGDIGRNGTCESEARLYNPY